ncbi:hypothetical protein SJAG_04730 [Schizosaccharomyces japonicus yFS275]|uniref:Uncharacterized protein n=1 Tax=Schizosaccharomyces japonicus (strain yFS275 / FY16936) TaxID=402676 RepID=B6K7L4_SCHJY|nr:hypothetical protein SJAG_04730 [Schizosaccharomyces japonicus yFS275]EEB09518.1 hypothetical protein SJAG_04730 [Schizosaccharomyces japonicus yFS275]
MDLSELCEVVHELEEKHQTDSFEKKVRALETASPVLEEQKSLSEPPHASPAGALNTDRLLAEGDALESVLESVTLSLQSIDDLMLRLETELSSVNGIIESLSAETKEAQGVARLSLEEQQEQHSEH